MSLAVECWAVGPLQVNCYVVHELGDAVIVDPGDEPDRIAARCDELGVRVRAILLTHGHVDHITGVGRLASRLSVPVVLSRAEHPLYFSTANTVPPWLPACADLPTPVEAVPPTVPWTVQMIPTPGHTPGGTCYRIETDRVVFSGDTLFRESVGRTDLPGGNEAALAESIRECLLSLPDDTVVYPGHGPATTVGHERAANPFLEPPP